MLTRIFSAPIFLAFIALVQSSAYSQTPGSAEDHFRRGITWQVKQDWTGLFQSTTEQSRSTLAWPWHKRLSRFFASCICVMSKCKQKPPRGR